VINGRAWPKWLSPLTVGPHTYIPTLPGRMDVNSSFFLVNELYTLSGIIYCTCLMKIGCYRDKNDGGTALAATATII
jgi:hypothetical protein